MTFDSKYLEKPSQKSIVGYQRNFPSKQHKNVFYQKRSVLRQNTTEQLSLLLRYYEGLPAITLERDHREKDISNRLQRYGMHAQYTYLKLEQVQEELEKRSNYRNKAINNGQKDLENFEYILGTSLEKRQLYEDMLVLRVSELKSILRKTRSLDDQNSGKRKTIFVETLLNSINEAHSTLVSNADHLGTNFQGYFHHSQLHPCPSVLRMRMVQQEPDANDCGPACVTALYGTRLQVKDLEEIAKNIYRRYSKEEISQKGTSIIQHAQVLGELGIPTESFSSTQELRMRLNRSGRVNPILARIGRYDTGTSHFITIADTTTSYNGEEMIAFSDSGTGDSYLVSLNEFLYASYGEYLRTI